ncbi:MAG: hypothetical protein A2Y84_01530, partial [Candidatus Colwellbacteria bacterium RBG_13_48_8]
FAPRFRGYRDKDDHVFRYPSLSVGYKAEYPLPLPTWRDAEFARAHKIDIVHAQHPWGIGHSALKLAKKLSVPIVFTNHTRYEFYVDYVPPLIPKRLMIRLVEGAAARFANKTNAVIVPTLSIKDYLIKNGVKESLIHILPSGVAASDLKNAPDANLRERYGIPGDHKLLLYFGRVGPEKNLPTILEAYKRIIEKEEKVTLVMAGGTKGAEAYLEFLKKYAEKIGISDRVHFTGIIPPEGRGGYFREGDIFIHSSLSETQGLILADAMVFGLPIVAIRASGVVDLIVDGENGLMTGPGPDELADGVLRVLREEGLREKLSEGAKKTAQGYTIEAVTKRLENIYKDLLASD